MDQNILSDVERKLVKELNFKLEKFEEIHKGLSNKLFILTSDTKAKLLLKIYYSKNDGHLEREFHALTFLKSKNFKNVPKAYFNNTELNYAVYSYEPGEEKKTTDLTSKDINQMTRLFSIIT